MTIKQIKDRFWGVYVFILSWIAFAGDAVAKVQEYAKNGKLGDYVCLGCAIGGPNPDKADCWVCDIFEFFFDTGNHVAYTTSEELLSASLKLLAVGLGLWLAFHIMPIVASFKTGNAMQTITGIGTVLLKALVVACFLSVGIKPIFEYIVSWPVSLAMGVSERMMQAVNTVNASFDGSAAIGAESSANTLGDDAKWVFDADVRSGMLGIVKGTFATIDYAQSLAGFLVCESARPYTINLAGIDIGTFPHFDFRLFNIGIVAWVLFGIMAIVFPFYLIDAVFRAILICLLAPLFMVAWVFPATVQYATKAFNILLGCVVTFVVMGLLVAVGIRIALIPVTGDTDFLSMCGDDDTLPDIPAMLLSSAQLFPAFGIMICGIIAIKYVKKVGDVVSVFGFDKVDTTVGDKMLKSAKTVAMAPVKAAAEMAETAVDAALIAATVFSYGAAAPATVAAEGAKIAAKEGAKATAKVAAEAAKEAAKAAAKAAAEAAAKAAAKAAQKTAQTALKNAPKAVKKVGKTATKAAKKAKEVGKKVSDTLKKAKDTAGKARQQASKAKNAIGNSKPGKVCDKVDKIGDKIKDKVKENVKEKAKEFGKKIVNNIKENVKDGINRQFDEITKSSDGSDG